MGRKRGAIVAGLVGFVALASVAPASATWPGANGGITFIRSRGGPYSSSVRTIHANGSTGTVLWPAGGAIETRHHLRPGDAMWSPDGTRVVYLARGSLGSGDRLLVGDPLAGSRTTIMRAHTLDPGGDTFFVAVMFAPTGDSLAFCAVNLSGKNEARFYTIDVDGTGLTKVSDRNLCPLDWSATDRILALAGARLGKVITMAPDGTHRQVVLPATDAHPSPWPSWSPDGARIVYAERVGARQQSDLFSISATGTDRVRLTRTPHKDEISPVYSPDGTAIAFTRLSRKPGSLGDVFTMATDGTSARRLTHTPRAYEAVASWRPIP